MVRRPNIGFIFPDQQRGDTVGFSGNRWCKRPISIAWPVKVWSGVRKETRPRNAMVFGVRLLGREFDHRRDRDEAIENGLRVRRGHHLIVRYP